MNCPASGVEIHFRPDQIPYVAIWLVQRDSKRRIRGNDSELLSFCVGSKCDKTSRDDFVKQLDAPGKFVTRFCF
jgi:hypothetical protein